MASTKPCQNKVQDKVAILTGGASGIGEATVLAFAEKGQELAESIGTNRSTYIHCDVTDENQVISLVESTVQLYCHLDVIFCNAGIASFGKQNVLDFG
ncbi:PREDICTED: (-)-isopiperitenol/(-)-carveol dehydrogenase, mitochondrial-like [Populus euphratica]|uniref:(-)-isopiperitenol/(-)-carveol dehydrogenase, mitochondrial-like n=1 Tax=Populus euphratica TaxID=75702 RepID=A0AAJ6Y5A0_POPEU|nr:PREDICTED: (-)-isopiperitenol/(-)-carveol dehydrogenase, mitochondrial-like [Populus euphratica]